MNMTPPKKDKIATGLVQLYGSSAQALNEVLPELSSENLKKIAASLDRGISLNLRQAVNENRHTNRPTPGKS